jgi:LL-diaminopimelate aminotransferase
MKFTQSDRLLAMPPYIFSEINTIKAEAEKRGVKLLSVGIGDPDLPTPKAIVEKFVDAIRKPENHAYSPYEGTIGFRNAVAEWFLGRFNVKLNPATEVIALIGSKEGIAHFPLAFCNSGDKCLYPSPGYPIFSTAVLLAGGIPVPVPHRPENNFLPDVEELESLIVQHKPKYILLNFPSNPTSATCSREKMAEFVNLAKKHGTILVCDNAYSEIYFNPSEKPVSVLEIEGAKDVAIEFHSLSKSFNMTGWRIGFAVGNPTLIAGLLRAKTNIDSGPLLAVQEAAIFALNNAERLIAPLRDVYARRRAIVLKGLQDMGIEYFEPKSTFFVWAKVPGNRSSMEFTKELIAKQGLVVTPGIGFGAEGEGFFRMSLTVSEEKLLEALTRLKRGIYGENTINNA